MDMFNKIYELSYMPLLTPYNLLDNLKLDNYTSINYKKANDGIIAEISCLIDECAMTFYYEFDSSNYLNKIYYYEDNDMNYLFNRENLLASYKSDYIAANSKKSS